MNIRIEEKKRMFKLYLKGVWVDAKPGELVLLIGSSGAGKTTVLNCLLKRTWFKGEVNVDSNCTYPGFVEQDPPLKGCLTVEQAAYLSSMYRWRGIPKSVRMMDINEAINLLGLEDIRHKKIKKLSGGQKKRTAMLTEMIGRPSMLVLDECCSGLDYANRVLLFKTEKKIAKMKNIPVICCSHSFDEGEEFFDRVIVIGRDDESVGRQIFSGGINECKKFFGVRHLSEIITLINPVCENGKGMTDHFLKKASYLLRAGNVETAPRFHRRSEDGTKAGTVERTSTRTNTVQTGKSVIDVATIRQGHQKRVRRMQA